MNWMLFVAKKMVTVVLYPLGTFMVLTACGIVLLVFTSKRRLGIGALIVGTVWLLLMSLPSVGSFLIRSLESDAGQYANVEQLKNREVNYIVVLGGDLRSGNLTPADRIAYTSLVRVMEGIRLWKGLPQSTLVLSGGRYSDRVMTTAEGMAILAKELGVDDKSIHLETQSWDTEAEAMNLKSLLGTRPFAMVTSASHMRRSLASFRRHGLDPIPAPCDFSPGDSTFVPWDLLPRAEGLVRSQRAMHEYLGIGFMGFKTWLLGISPPAAPVRNKAHIPTK